MKIEIEPYAKVPEGWELTGEWAESVGEPYLSITGSLGFMPIGIFVPRLALRRKTKKQTVLTARVVLPEGRELRLPHSYIETKSSEGLFGSLEFFWNVTTEEVPVDDPSAS